MLPTLKKIKAVLNRFIMIIAAVLTIVLVCGALWQVFSRYVLGSPSIFTEELLRFLLFWVAMLGATYAFGSKEHLAITFLKNKLRDIKRKSIELFIDAAILCFTGIIMIKGGYSLVTTTLNQTSPILGIPMGYVYAILPISGVIIAAYQLINMMERKEQADSTEQLENTTVSPHTREE
ncbi:TRAP transporter small permease [Gracilibacillus oryzae]|uniref:TRAP transporter small permease n=1 Tax=Gracilibacillus oryzae TaxID=1672701 RepID=A0A7C8GTK6_9BACI|nr:TRAP transporter small permease [Gracilibacillus oryzae]KAB8134516.1 TRAP transporter small permease [Gracilibacillus oryzae]